MLLTGSDFGGESAATRYSLIGSALLDDRDPYLYLRHVLAHPRASDPSFGEWLPRRLTPEMPVQRCA